MKRNGLDWHVWGWATKPGVLIMGVSGLAAMNGALSIRSLEPTDMWFWVHAALISQGLWFFARLRTWRTSGNTHHIYVPGRFWGSREIPFGELRHAFVHPSGVLWLRLKDGELVKTPIEALGNNDDLIELRDTINAQLGLPPGHPEPPPPSVTPG